MLDRFSGGWFGVVAWVVIIVNLIFASWYVLHGEIFFHTDIARDFVLMWDIAYNKNITLIGPRAGGIEGLFHGPLWWYVNLPAFILGGGNPIIVGWFWVILQILFLYSVYFISKKIFNRQSALIATSILAAKTALFTNKMYNPDGAILIMPILFYWLFRFFETHKTKFVVFISLLLGALIHFEAAFGGPISIIVFFMLFTESVRSKTFKPLLGFATILAPLSTYIVFDIRHDFFQLKSVIRYFQQAFLRNGSGFLETVSSRLDLLIFKSTAVLSSGSMSLNVLLSILFIFLLYKSFKGKDFLPYRLYLQLLLGYWGIMFFYSSSIPGFYYQPLVILSIIMFSGLIFRFPKILIALILFPILVINTFHAGREAFSLGEFSGKDYSSWKFNYGLARTIVDDAPSDFGYYILSPDLFAYSPRYGMLYVDKITPEKEAYAFEKRSVTYVLVSQEALDGTAVDYRWWRDDQVKIKKKPVKTIIFDEKYVIEKYELSDDEVAVPIDSNLFQGNQFH